MAYTERLQILLQSGINDLCSPPSFSLEACRHYFSLNDREAKVAKSIRKRSHRCFFVALLGYFKSKPVVFNPRFGQVEQDLQFISKEQLPGPGLRRFTLDQRQKDRLYQKVFDVLNYKKWHDHQGRNELLNKANDAINNAVAKLAIFKHYNIQEDLIHASADGQIFESRLETFKTRYSSKYFGTNKGVSSLALVVNHAALNAKIIGSNESHYIFDLLQSNTSEIKPDVLSTDTHGVNHVNFALLDLFGYSFAPRYANFSKVIEDMFNVGESKEHCVKMSLKKPIKTDVTIDH